MENNEKRKLRASDIRKILIEEYSLAGNTLLHELTFPTNQTIADFLVINDSIIGFEIKSDVDTFVRLPKQIEGYDSICQLNWIVIGESKQKNIEERVPEHWGIIKVFGINGKNEFQILREAKQNTQWSYENLLLFLPSVNLKRFAKTIPEMLEINEYKKSLIQKMTKSKIIEQIMALSTFCDVKEKIMAEVITYLKGSELREKRELFASVNKQIRDLESKEKDKEIKYRLDYFEYLDEELQHLRVKKKIREKDKRTVDIMTNFNYLLRDLTKKCLPLCLEYNNKGVHLAYFEFEEETDKIRLIVEDKKDCLVIQESKRLWEVLFECVEKSYNLRKTKTLLKELQCSQRNV